MKTFGETMLACITAYESKMHPHFTENTLKSSLLAVRCVGKAQNKYGTAS